MIGTPLKQFIVFCPFTKAILRLFDMVPTFS